MTIINRSLALLVGAVVAFAPSWANAQAHPYGDGYALFYIHVSEDGERLEMPLPVADGSQTACEMAKKKEMVPRTVPKGNIISPGGTSKAWTIVAVECRNAGGVIRWAR